MVNDTAIAAGVALGAAWLLSQGGSGGESDESDPVPRFPQADIPPALQRLPDQVGAFADGVEQAQEQVYETQEEISEVRSEVEAAQSGGSDTALAAAIESLGEVRSEVEAAQSGGSDTALAAAIESLGTSEVGGGVSGGGGTPRPDTTPGGRTEPTISETLEGENRLADWYSAGSQSAKAGGNVLGEAGQFVSDNPIASLGTAAGVAAAPITGGASVPVGIAAGGAVGEIGTDLATGQYGPSAGETVGKVTDAVGNIGNQQRKRAAEADSVGETVDKVTDALGNIGNQQRKRAEKAKEGPGFLEGIGKGLSNIGNQQRKRARGDGNDRGLLGGIL